MARLADLRVNSRMEYVGFGVNIGNLGRSRPEGRPTSAELCLRWNQILQVNGLHLRIHPAYRGTGNFFLTGEGGWSVGQVAETLRSVTGRAFAVFRGGDYLAWVGELAAALPGQEKLPVGRRMTLGAVMDTNPAGGMPPGPPAVATFAPTGFVRPRVLGVWKVDRLRADGKALDSSVSARDGGWGAIARTMRRRHGGEWTARAISTLEGVARRLETCGERLPRHRTQGRRG